MTDREGRIAACKAQILIEARKFALLMAEFDGDVACCDVSMTELLDATDRLMALEREGEGG